MPIHFEIETDGLYIMGQESERLKQEAILEEALKRAAEDQETLLQAEKEKQATLFQAEKEKQEALLQAEKEKQETLLQAEKEKQEALLQVEKEKQEAIEEELRKAENMKRKAIFALYKEGMSLERLAVLFEKTVGEIEGVIKGI